MNNKEYCWDVMTNTKTIKHDVTFTQNSTDLHRLLEIAEDIHEDMKNEKKITNSTEEWKLVAMVLDRLFLIIFAVTGMLLSLIILTRTGPYDENILKIAHNDIYYS